MRRKRRVKDNERGATLVEFTIVFLIVFVLIGAIIEFSAYLNDYVVSSRVAREGGRVAAIAGPERTADFHILEAIRRAAGNNVNKIDAVVIYRPADLDNPQALPPGCATASVTNTCNSYTGDQVRNLTEGDFGCDGRVDSAFCPFNPTNPSESNRRDTLSYASATGPQSGTDVIGVHITYQHPSIMGTFIGRATLDKSSVARVEARRYE